ncbi:MAG: riboflavin biosynthesis protein RibD [Lentisphaerae bacterium GWF2_44_16]|nr:MAG: riboflavin biosynthesis protein RibD [Lentisphaerae bacterium GWF2_44_16]
MSEFSEKTDAAFMRTALALAKKGWGLVSPNPMVGALIVRKGKVIGRGFHRKAGGPHAEINAMSDASAPFKGSTLYVTLEPCSTFGRTPPCVDAIIKAEISRVVIGVLDPNPRHAGRAVKILEENGIAVTVGIAEKKCRELNESFFKWIVSGTPFVLLKLATTLDGKIATAGGESKWITGASARRRVQTLRRWADAIMVGGETVRRDAPSLTVREPDDWKRQPRRIVCSKTMTVEKLTAMMPEGRAPELVLPLSLKEWQRFLKKLGAENVTSLLVEGGGELASSVLNAGIVDKVEFHIAPKILGGRNSRSSVGGENPLSLADALNISDVSIRKYGCDIAVSGYIKKK